MAHVSHSDRQADYEHDCLALCTSSWLSLQDFRVIILMLLHFNSVLTQELSLVYFHSQEIGDPLYGVWEGEDAGYQLAKTVHQIEQAVEGLTKYMQLLLQR